MASDPEASASNRKHKKKDKMDKEQEFKEETLERSIEDIRSKMKEKRRKKHQADLSLSRSRHKNATLVLKATLRQNNRNLARGLEAARNESRQAQQGLIELQRERHLLQTVVNRYQEQHVKQREKIVGVRELLSKVTTSLLDTVGLLGQALDMCVMPRQTKDSSLGLVFRNSSVNSDDLSDFEKKETRRPSLSNKPATSIFKRPNPAKQTSPAQRHDSSSDSTGEDSGLTTDAHGALEAEITVPDLPDIDIPLLFVSDDEAAQPKVKGRRDTGNIVSQPQKLSRRTSSLLDPTTMVAAAAEIGKSVDQIRTVVEETMDVCCSDSRQELPGDDLSHCHDDREKEEDKMEEERPAQEKKGRRLSRKRSGKRSQKKETFVTEGSSDEDMVMIVDDEDDEADEANVRRGRKSREQPSRRRDTQSKGRKSLKDEEEIEQVIKDGEDASRRQSTSRYSKGRSSLRRGTLDMDKKTDLGDGDEVLTEESSQKGDDVSDAEITHMNQCLDEETKSNQAGLAGEDMLKDEHKTLETMENKAEKSDYKVVDMEMTDAGLGHISVSDASALKHPKKTSQSDTKGSADSGSDKLAGSGDPGHTQGMGQEREKPKKSRLPVKKKDKTKSLSLKKHRFNDQARSGKCKDKRDRTNEKDAAQATVFDLSMGDSFSHPTPPHLAKHRPKAPSKETVKKEQDVKGYQEDESMKEGPGNGLEIASDGMSVDDNMTDIPAEKHCKIKRKSRKSKSVVTPGGGDNKRQISEKALLEELGNLDASFFSDVTKQERTSKIGASVPSRKSHNTSDRVSLSDLMTMPLVHKASKRKLSKQRFYLGQDDFVDDGNKGASLKAQKPERSSYVKSSEVKQSGVINTHDTHDNDNLENIDSALNTSHDLLQALESVLSEAEKPVKSNSIPRRTTILKAKGPTQCSNLNVTFDLGEDRGTEREDFAKKKEEVVVKKAQSHKEKIKKKKTDRKTYFVTPQPTTSCVVEDDIFERLDGVPSVGECSTLNEATGDKMSLKGTERPQRDSLERNILDINDLDDLELFNDIPHHKKKRDKKPKQHKSKKRLADEEDIGRSENKRSKVSRQESLESRSGTPEVVDDQDVMRDVTNTTPGTKHQFGHRDAAQNSPDRPVSRQVLPQEMDNLQGCKVEGVDQEERTEDVGKVTETQENEEAPSRRARRSKAVSYKEPSLNSKLRRGDPNTETIYKGSSLATKKARKIKKEVLSATLPT